MFRCHGWEFYVKFLEKFGHPLIHAKLDSQPKDPITGESNFQAFANMLNGTKRPTAIVTGLEGELNVFNPAQSSGQFKDFINCINKRIHMAILGQTLTSDNSDGGSNALGQVHNLVREDKARSDRRLVEKTINQVIGFIGFYNEIAQDRLPVFEFEDIKGLNTERANRDQTLNAIGVRFSKEYIADVYNIPEDQFELAQGDILESLGFSDKALDHDCYKFIDPDDPKQVALENLQQSYADASPVSISTEELEAAIRSSVNKRDLETKLSALVGQEGSRFTDTLTQALYEMHVRGFLDAEQTT